MISIFFFSFLAVWGKTAKAFAVRNDSDDDDDDDEADEEDDALTRPSDLGECYKRFRYHASPTNFFIIAESCVNRKYTAKVSDEDDRIVELKATFEPPPPNILDQLFTGHRVEFGFEEGVKQEYVFYLNAGEKLARKPPVVTCSPNSTTPLWYGFQFDFALKLPETEAANVDFTETLMSMPRPVVGNG